MFYSHEILTSRKYGVATVWLVATLGSKSGMRKINRKEIQDVDIPKACSTITAPEAPMALRLQSSLLYGVSRVYAQQCSYVLVDAQAAQSQMRALMKVVRSSELDPHAGEARPEQLVLQDDPEFLPEMILPSLDISLGALAFSSEGVLHSNSILFDEMSIAGHKGARSPLDLIIPSSGSRNVGDFGGFSIRDSSTGTGQRGMVWNPAGEDDGFDPNVDFNFDADGNLIEVGAQLMGQASDARITQPRIRSSSAVSARVRQEHAEGNIAGQEALEDQMNMDWNIGGAQGLNYDLPELSDFPELGAQSIRPHQSPANCPAVPEQETMAIQQRNKRRLPRSLPADLAIQVRKSELSAWGTHYATNMTKESKSKVQKRNAIARANAEYFVFGSGLGGIGNGIGTLGVISPLATFANNSLLEALQASSHLRQKISRRLSDADLDNEARRVRSRSSEDDELARGDAMILEDNDPLAMILEDSIELPRNALPLLDDPSSVMPWNQATILPPSRPGSTIPYPTIPSSASAFPASAKFNSSAGLSLGRRASRLPSTSPLHGRGTHGSVLAQGPLGVEDNYLPNPGDTEDLGMAGDSDLALADFQLFGAAAGINTQLADDSQWVNAALDSESGNFLDFVKAELDALAPDHGGSVVQPSQISFEELLPPATHTRIVAAQAFLHVLTLATKGVLKVEQKIAFGHINLALARRS